MPADTTFKADATNAHVVAAGRETYDDLIARGVPAWQAGATFEWHCEGCGRKTWLSHAGGSLDCDCPSLAPTTLDAATNTIKQDPAADDRAKHTHVHRMLAGHREYLGTAYSIAHPS